jgi:NADH dehydrogenase
MPPHRTDLVTGAFSFSGRHIAHILLERGIGLRTLTGHPHHAHPFGDRVEVCPYRFDDPRELQRSLEGVETLFNTYWVRFDHGAEGHASAIENSRRLFAAARSAGVRRIVHVSIANPSESSPLPYYRGKARLERELRESGISHAIVRPTVLFGEGGILINNIAWLLRRFPVFAIPGRGDYRIQPVHVDDLAKLCVELGDRSDDVVVDAVGPETYRYRDLVRLIRSVTASRSLIVHLPPALALHLGRLLGRLEGDVLITRDELAGLQRDLLISHRAPTCTTRLSQWLEVKRDLVGRRYLSELALHYRPTAPSAHDVGSGDPH